MKLSTHLIWQGIAMLLQGVNQYDSAIPPKFKPVAALLVGIGQVVLAWRAHYYNPDGTPAATAWQKQ